MLSFPNAKINIGLFVTEKRPDGYHNLETVFYPVPIKDVLEILPADEMEMKIHGLDIVGEQHNNLVWKAWTLLQQDYPEQVSPVSIHLLKHIPMGAGMGGGSADGAFMLRLLNDYFELGLNASALKDYALRLGSDCPFFIDNKPSFASGRGEVLSPISLDLSPYSLQVICPGLHISTATAFGQLVPKPASFDLRALSALPVSEWHKQVHNDFEPAIFAAHPLLEQIKAHLYSAGAVYASMSGTGSTIYGFFEKGIQADLSDFTGLRHYYFR
jgi:4-diphosphocytidyl-2-C-methyl-D-erythritol kinase